MYPETRSRDILGRMSTNTRFTKGSRLRNRFIFFFIILAVVPVLVLGGVSLALLNQSHREDVRILQNQLLDQKVQEIEKFLADTVGVLDLKVSLEEDAPISPADQAFLLEGILGAHDAFREVSFVTLEGRESAVRVRGEDPRDRIDVSGSAYFQQAKAGESYTAFSADERGPLLVAASPVRNRKGTIIQVLAGRVRLDEITSSVREARLGEEGFVSLADTSGTLIASGDPQGERNIGNAYVASRAVSGPGWVLRSAWPARDADAIIHIVRVQVVLVLAFSILAVLLVAPFLAHRLVAPIRDLQRAAAAIERGDFEKEVDVRTGDELEDLGAAFNSMREGLKRLRELQNEFVFVATHELRAPVTAIRWYLEDALPMAEGGSVREVLEKINAANVRLERLVQDLLEIARAEAGKLTIDVAPCDMAASVKQVLEEMEPDARQRGVSLSYREIEGTCAVMADEIRLKEILANLVSNAVKYNKEGGSVEIFHERKDGVLATHVRDTGLGIPSKDQRRIFEKFFRVEGKDRRDVPGTGLGLFITKQLAERMGGRIWFESREGEGATFSFELPVAQEKRYNKGRIRS